MADERRKPDADQERQPIDLDHAGDDDADVRAPDVPFVDPPVEQGDANGQPI